MSEDDPQVPCPLCNKEGGIKVRMGGEWCLVCGEAFGWILRSELRRLFRELESNDE